MRFSFTVQRRRRSVWPLETFEAEALSLLDHLYGAALRLTGRRTDAEDLVQRAYLEAFRTAECVPCGTTMKVWLFTLLYDTYRQAGGTTFFESGDEDAGVSDVTALGPDSDESGDPKRLWTASDAELKAALDSLPNPLRQIVYLRDLEGFSCVEIARMLQLATVTVQRRIGRGRRLLCQLLKHRARPRGFALAARAAL